MKNEIEKIARSSVAMYGSQNEKILAEFALKALTLLDCALTYVNIVSNMDDDELEEYAIGESASEAQIVSDKILAVLS